MQKPSKLIFTVCSLVLLLLFNKQVTMAAVPHVHISAKPTWLSTFKPYNQKPSARSIERGFYYALIEEQEQVEKQASYHHTIKQIVADAGIQNASQISVSFDPSYQRLDFHEITVWRDNKPINKLSQSAFKIIADEQDLSNFIYQGTYSALCILADVRKGDRIDYSYTLTGRNPIFNNKYCDEFYFQWYQPIAHKYTVVIASDQRKLNFKIFNKPPVAKVTEADGLKRYEYEDFQVPAAHEDDNEPYWYDTRGHVQISEFNSWAEVVDWARSINPTAVNIKGELLQKINAIKAKAGSDKEKYFRDAVRVVQDEVRYMGIEIGQYSHRANTPEKVFEQRYGDCKDKSLLLVSILQADGIDASMVLINTNMNEHVDEFMPSYYAFNHATVTATVNGKQVWVDATINYQGGEGTDIYYPRYGKGLVLKPGSNSLTIIPPSKAGKVVYNDIYKVTNAKSAVLFTVKSTYTMNEADDTRSRLASTGMAETEKNYLEYYSKIYSKIATKDSMVVVDDLKRNVLTTTETYLVNDFFSKDSVSGKLTASLFANYIWHQMPTITGLTKTPVSVSYPTNIDYTINVLLPGGWNVTKQENSLNRDAYKFSSICSASGDTLSLNYKFSYLTSFVPVNKLAQFKADIKDLNDNRLGYTFSYNPDAKVSTFKLNNSLVLYIVILVVSLVFLTIWLYQRETPGIVFAAGATFIPLGGWLILVTIALFITPLMIGARLITDKYFDMSVWNSYAATKHDLEFKVLIVLETTGNVLMMSYAIFCLVLMLTKRDIFPRYIIGYLAFVAIFMLAEYFWVLTMDSDTMTFGALKSLVRAIISAAIWIPYFRKSTRVEETFIVPYPPYNYSYEKAEVPDKASY